MLKHLPSISGDSSNNKIQNIREETNSTERSSADHLSDSGTFSSMSAPAVVDGGSTTATQNINPTVVHSELNDDLLPSLSLGDFDQLFSVTSPASISAHGRSSHMSQHFLNNFHNEGMRSNSATSLGGDGSMTGFSGLDSNDSFIGLRPRMSSKASQSSTKNTVLPEMGLNITSKSYKNIVYDEGDDVDACSQRLSALLVGSVLSAYESNAKTGWSPSQAQAKAGQPSLSLQKPYFNHLEEHTNSMPLMGLNFDLKTTSDSMLSTSLNNLSEMTSLAGVDVGFTDLISMQDLVEHPPTGQADVKSAFTLDKQQQYTLQEKQQQQQRVLLAHRQREAKQREQMKSEMLSVPKDSISRSKPDGNPDTKTNFTTEQSPVSAIPSLPEQLLALQTQILNQNVHTTNVNQLNTQTTSHSNASNQSSAPLYHRSQSEPHAPMYVQSQTRNTMRSMTEERSSSHPQLQLGANRKRINPDQLQRTINKLHRGLSETCETEGETFSSNILNTVNTNNFRGTESSCNEGHSTLTRCSSEQTYTQSRHYQQQQQTSSQQQQPSSQQHQPNQTKMDPTLHYLTKKALAVAAAAAAPIHAVNTSSSSSGTLAFTPSLQCCHSDSELMSPDSRSRANSRDGSNMNAAQRLKHQQEQLEALHREQQKQLQIQQQQQQQMFSQQFLNHLHEQQHQQLQHNSNPNTHSHNQHDNFSIQDYQTQLENGVVGGYESPYLTHDQYSTAQSLSHTNSPSLIKQEDSMSTNTDNGPASVGRAQVSKNEGGTGTTGGSGYSYPNAESTVLKFSDVYEWLHVHFEECDRAFTVPRTDLYNMYCDHCEKKEISPAYQPTVGKVVRIAFPDVTIRRLGNRKNSKYHYCGIKLKPEYQSYYETLILQLRHTQRQQKQLEKAKEENLEKENRSREHMEHGQDHEQQQKPHNQCQTQQLQITYSTSSGDGTKGTE
eukprot:CFRG4081T1